MSRSNILLLFLFYAKKYCEELCYYVYREAAKQKEFEKIEKSIINEYLE